MPAAKHLMVIAMLLWCSGAAAQGGANCYTGNGMTAPAATVSSVAALDASTYHMPTQRQQARDLLLGEIQPGRSFTIYVFARGVGQESLQRAAHFTLPPYVNDPWKVAADRSEAVNECLRNEVVQVTARASAAIDKLLGDYVPFKEGESPIAQAFTATVAAHPKATRFYLVANGVQHERAGYSLYDIRAAPATQAVRRIDPRADAAALARRARLAMTRTMSVTMFPVGQVEPGDDGQMHQRRSASEVTALVDLWKEYFTSAGAGRVSVTSFVPVE